MGTWDAESQAAKAHQRPGETADTAQEVFVEAMFCSFENFKQPEFGCISNTFLTPPGVAKFGKSLMSASWRWLCLAN